MCLYTCSYRCNFPVNGLNSISVQVKERRFKDAAQLCRTWALEILEEVAEASRNNLPQEEEKRRYKEYCEHKENADLYYAYSFIDQSISEPFRTTMPEILFNIARFLLSRCTKQTPQGISLVNILVTLAEHSKDLGKLPGLHQHCKFSNKTHLPLHKDLYLLLQEREIPDPTSVYNRLL